MCLFVCLSLLLSSSLLLFVIVVVVFFVVEKNLLCYCCCCVVVVFVAEKNLNLILFCVELRNSLSPKYLLENAADTAEKPSL